MFTKDENIPRAVEAAAMLEKNVMNVGNLFERGVSLSPEDDFLISGEMRLTYKQAQRHVHQFAGALDRNGVRLGDHGAVLAPNDPMAWLATLAMWRTGVAWIPLNPRNPIAENIALINRFRAKILFVHPLFEDAVSKARAALPKDIQIVSLGDPFAAVFTPLCDWRRDGDEAFTPREPEPDALAAIAPTGGTTGRPKGVMLTHRNIMTFAASFMVNTPYADKKPVCLAAAPMTHTAGVTSLPATARGGKIVIMTKPDPAELLDIIEKRRVTEFFLPPTVIYRLLETPGLKDRDYSSLEYFCYGAAPMSVEKLKQAIDVFGPVMTQFFGQTEAPITISCLSREAHASTEASGENPALHSCGRPTPFIKVDIQDADGQSAPAGQVGEICVRGDLVMKGYFEDPAQTARVMRDGWLRTGDLGRIDEAGLLHITGRQKDMIITGGFNVYPTEVEQVIWEHPSVQDCAVIGIPSEQWGEQVHAIIELNEGQDLDDSEVISLCKDKLGSVKSPKTVEFRKSLPRSPVGKVLKRELRDEYWS